MAGPVALRAGNTELKRALAAHPKSAVGKTVVKAFAEGVFTGEVVNFFNAAETAEKECLWEVRFSDGDHEDFTYSMLEAVLTPEAVGQIVAECKASKDALLAPLSCGEGGEATSTSKQLLPTGKGEHDLDDKKPGASHGIAKRAAEAIMATSEDSQRSYVREVRCSESLNIQDRLFASL